VGLDHKRSALSIHAQKHPSFTKSTFIKVIGKECREPIDIKQSTMVNYFEVGRDECELEPERPVTIV
jgi:hypothetical protein